MRIPAPCPRLPRAPLAALLMLLLPGAGALTPAASQRQVFRSGRDLISVDVVVRDRSGAIVRGLTAADFEIREDGRPQTVERVSFEEIASTPLPPMAPANLLAGVETAAARGAAPAPQQAADAEPMASRLLAGRRLVTLLFDVSSMQPEEVQRAVDAARQFVEGRMAGADLVAVAAIGSRLDVLTDFTDDRARVLSALGRLAFAEGIAAEGAAAPAAEAAEEEEADAPAAEAAELDLFNNDLRLRALRILAEALSPIDQKKAILYFSAGMARSGQDNQVELRSAVNAAVRGHVAIYAVDTRGLQAVVPGGDARQASGRGTSLFSGRGVSQQFDRLASSQDTLVSLAADTGGRAFTDSNDFGEAFDRVQRDLSGYYLLGYSTTNAARDGRFRRIQVRLRKNAGYRVEARAGYYAPRDFTHTSRADRERQLEDQLAAAVSATDLPVFLTAGWFRLSADRFHVPIALAVPGTALPAPAAAEPVSLDILGLIRDERNAPVGRFRETLTLPAAGTALAGRQVLYQSGVTLPPGRFTVKAVVRENTTGLVGSFEAPVLVPVLPQAALKVSPVVLSTQIQPAPKGRTDNPLVRDGIQLLPNLTRVVGRGQRLFFYYEVYDPAQAGGAPHLRTSLAFYRGRVKVLETPVVERTVVDVPARRAALFQFELPAGSFAPGTYTCQINVIDAVAGRFEFPRLVFAVR